MKILRFLTHLALFLCFHEAVEASSKVETAKQRIVAMNNLANIFKSYNFDEFKAKLSEYARVAIPMVNSFYSVVTDKNITKDEIAEVRTSFNLVSNSIGQLSTDFESIKRSIQWSVIQVNYGQLESAVKAAMGNLNQVLEAPFQVRDSVEAYFVTKYETDFGNAGFKIHEGLINEGVFTSNLIKAAREYTGDHRRQVRVFGMGIMQLLLQAVEVEMLYYQLKYKTEEHTEFIQNTWDRRLEKIKNKLINEDNEIPKGFAKQQEIDRVRLLSENRHLNNKDFVDKFYNYMTDKYDWKEWFAMAYNGVSHPDVTQCGGGISLNTYGRNLVYSTQDKATRTFNPAAAKNLMDSIPHVVELRGTSDVLKLLNNKAGPSCNPYALRTVIDWRQQNPSLSYSYGNAISKVVCLDKLYVCHHAYLFG